MQHNCDEGRQIMTACVVLGASLLAVENARAAETEYMLIQIAPVLVVVDVNPE